MHLPDVNFWIALAFRSHTHHVSAKAWMDSAAKQSCCFCRVTQMGFLRLATNRKIFPSDAISMHEAWRVYDQMMPDERIAFADEPQDIGIAWRNFTQLGTYSTNVWSDAYLAAFAITADFDFVTFDKGFTQFANLRCTILS